MKFENRKNMLVYIVPTSYPNEQNPVANSFVEEQALALEAAGCNVVVLNVQKQPVSHIFIKKSRAIVHTKRNNIFIVATKLQTFFEKKFVAINQYMFNKKMCCLYKEAVKKYGEADVIYAHFYSAAYSVLKIKENKAPIVVMEHSGNIMQETLSFTHQYILKYVVKHVDKYIATTGKLKEKILQHTKSDREILIIPNIVDEQFDFCPSKNKDSKFVFFSLARLEFDKRVDLLIDSFCKAFSKDENVFLRIGGQGTEEIKLRKLIQKNNREKQIILLGRLNRSQVVKEMELCSSFVLPSRHETFGMVWREAMAVGRPVITTDHGGFSSYDWKEEYGVMVSVDSERELTDALRHIYSNYEQYNLTKISRENRERYSAVVISNQLIEIFNSLNNSK